MFRPSRDVRKRISANKHRLKNSIAALIIGLGLAGTAVLTAAANGTVNWDGQQGLTNGQLTTSQCDEQHTGYLFWVFTLGGGNNTVSSATLTLGGSGSGTFPMTQVGNEMRATTGFFDLATLTASASYVGNLGSGNTNLTISHGCAPLTAKVKLTKTFAQGPFTTLPTSGDACFTLSPAAGTSDATQCSNSPEWDGLTPNSYTVTESTTPAHYATMAAINFTIANDCTGVSGTCVQTGNSTAFELGPVENTLLPGHLQVIKQLGPLGTTWTGPNVTFYVCAHNPSSDSTALTPTTCNASTSGVQTLTFNTNQTTPTVSGDLAEGYYTVCENVPSGYTVDHQCQEAQVFAGSVGSDNSLTYVNTPVNRFWCSPGFWATALKQNRTGVLAYLFSHTTPSISLGSVHYSVISGGAPLSKKAPAGDPTLAQILLSPNTYGGPAFNSVADYLAAQLGWTGTQLTGENCPLDAHGTFLTVL